MQRKIIIIALSIILFISISIEAQTELQSSDREVVILSLDDFIQKVLETNYSLAIQRQSLAKTGASKLGAWSSFMPNASTRFSWSRSGEDRYNFDQSGFSVSRDYYSGGFSASQTLFAGGRNYFDLRNSMLSYRSAEESIDDKRAEIILSAKEAFYTAIGARQAEANAYRALERTRDQWALVAQRDTLGMADPTEVSQIKVSLAQTELALLQAINARKKSEESLLVLLSHPLGDSVELREPPETKIELEPLDYYIALALEKSPLVRAAELSLKQARLSRLSSWGDYLPGVSSSFNYSWGGSEFPGSLSELDDEASWSVGISASWTLVSGTSRISSIKYANYDVREKEIRLAEARQSVEILIRDAYRRSTEAFARIGLAEARLADAKLNFLLFDEKYKLGNCTLLELLQAELTLREAEDEKISAEFDYQTAVAELIRWTGADENSE